MSEQHYLVINGKLGLSWPVPPDLAQVINEACVACDEPYLIPPASADSTMYAVDAGCGDYTLHLETPQIYEEPQAPTWRVYLSKHEVDVTDPVAVKAWVAEQGRNETDEIDLDELIDGDTLEHWRCWDYDLYESPMARAYRYLDALPLGKKGPPAGVVLGDLQFVEGDRPGSNLTYVTAPDLASLACLQERLKELNQNVRIEIYPNA